MGPLRHGFNFFRVGANSPAVYDVPEVLQFGSTKVAFVWIKPEAGVTKSAEDLGEMLQMLVESRTNDDDVVQVYKYVGFEFGPKDAVQ